jgi:hypothetical protein
MSTSSSMSTTGFVFHLDDRCKDLMKTVDVEVSVFVEFERLNQVA